MYQAEINAYFSWCVQLLYDISSETGIASEELNVWVFVVIHPIITLILACWVFRLRRQIKGPSKAGRARSPEIIRLEPPTLQMP